MVSQQPASAVNPQAGSTAVHPGIVKSLIDNEQHNLSELITLLEREQQLLAERDGQALQQMMGSKAQLLNALQQNQQAREQMLQQAGMKPTPNHWRRLLLTLDKQHKGSLARQWHRLEKELARCKAQNETNGKIIHRTQFTVSHLLDVLRGKFGQPKLYNQQGTTGANSGISRTITSA